MPNSQYNYNQQVPMIDQVIEEINKKINQEYKIKSLKINTNNILEILNETRISELLLLIARNTLFITVPTVILLNMLNSWQMINFFPHNLGATESLNQTLLLGMSGLLGTGIFKLQRLNDKRFYGAIKFLSKNTDHITNKINNNTRYSSNILHDLSGIKSELTHTKDSLNTILTPLQRQNLVVSNHQMKQIQALLSSYSLNTILLFLVTNRLDELSTYDKSIDQVSKNTYNKIQNELDAYRIGFNSVFQENILKYQVQPEKQSQIFIKKQPQNEKDKRKYYLTYEEVLNKVEEKIKNDLFKAYEEKPKLTYMINYLRSKQDLTKKGKIQEMLQNSTSNHYEKLRECEDSIQRNEQCLANLQNWQITLDLLPEDKRRWLFSKESVTTIYNALVNNDILSLTLCLHNELLETLLNSDYNLKSHIYQMAKNCLDGIQTHKERIIVNNQYEFIDTLNYGTIPRKPANFR